MLLVRLTRTSSQRSTTKSVLCNDSPPFHSLSSFGFSSSVKGNTLNPVWNEIWRIKNVPSNADIVVKVMDKDEGKILDDSIGKFKTSVSPGAKEIAIEGMLSRARGSFWLKVRCLKHRKGVFKIHNRYQARLPMMSIVKSSHISSTDPFVIRVISRLR